MPLNNLDKWRLGNEHAYLGVKARVINQTTTCYSAVQTMTVTGAGGVNNCSSGGVKVVVSLMSQLLFRIFVLKAASVSRKRLPPAKARCSISIPV